MLLAGDAPLMLCGSITNRSAYAFVNREILAGLRGAGRAVQQVDNLALAHDFPGTVIHYDYLQHFNTVTRPPPLPALHRLAHLGFRTLSAGLA